MKTKLKKDLIQGLLTYPAPVSGGRRNSSRRFSSQRKFFQLISPVVVRPARLSRGRSPTLIEPKVGGLFTKPGIWQDLKHRNNI